MVRGTTPTIKMNFDNVDMTMFSQIYLTIKQTENVPYTIEKSIEDIDVTEHSIEVRLTQEDTLGLQPYHKTLLQVRAITDNGVAVATKRYDINVSDILKDGVIHA